MHIHTQNEAQEEMEERIEYVQLCVHRHTNIQNRYWHALPLYNVTMAASSLLLSLSGVNIFAALHNQQKAHSAMITVIILAAHENNSSRLL